MRILLCSENPLVQHMGAPKVLIELANALINAGHTCDLIDPLALGIKPISDVASQIEYSQRLARYLATQASSYDVVDYNHAYLPFPRVQFPSETLFVARSVLLVQHLERIRISQPAGLRAAVGRFINGRSRQRSLKSIIARADETVRQADLVNVSNNDDRTELIRRGILSEKIVVLPFGMHSHRRALYDAIPDQHRSCPVIAFVGTFDYRKGANDFPRLVRNILMAIPHARFKLLGTSGLFSTETEVLAFFDPKDRTFIEVVPRFDPDELPQLLSECSIGMFPSYYEGFGFGVLEMLAAGLPVIAYDAPGPPMMLPHDHLVAPGDIMAMSAKIIALLRDPEKLSHFRAEARKISRGFQWEIITINTVQAYEKAVSSLRCPRSACAGVNQ